MEAPAREVTWIEGMAAQLGEIDLTDAIRKGRDIQFAELEQTLRLFVEVMQAATREPEICQSVGSAFAPSLSGSCNTMLGCIHEMRGFNTAEGNPVE